MGPNTPIVLVYHSVAHMHKKDDPFKLNVPPDLFETHMKMLSQVLKKRDILVTFDDGYESFYHHAFPILLKYKIPTQLFVATDFIDKKITFDHLFHQKNLRPLTWEELKIIAQNGISIGSHSLSHSMLAKLPYPQVYVELAESKKRIEQNVGYPVMDFAYPFGSRSSLNDITKKTVQECGYEKAYLNLMGFNRVGDDCFALRRIRIYPTDSSLLFKMKIKGLLNWIDWINSIRKSPIPS